ncbi:hypothetical protein Pelo_8425 [Pelomyxa schiedti]|nr:hypothetical protein Pelo_8425 [Pelomyxa schiedti]
MFSGSEWYLLQKTGDLYQNGPSAASARPTLDDLLTQVLCPALGNPTILYRSYPSYVNFGIAPDDEDPSSSPSVSGSGPTRSANCTADRGVVHSGWNWLTPNIWAQFWGLWNARNLDKVSWPAFAERFLVIFGIWIGDLKTCGNTGPYITETRWLGLLKYWSNGDNSGPDAKIIAMWRKRLTPL